MESAHGISTSGGPSRDPRTKGIGEGTGVVIREIPAGPRVVSGLSHASNLLHRLAQDYGKAVPTLDLAAHRVTCHVTVRLHDDFFIFLFFFVIA